METPETPSASPEARFAHGHHDGPLEPVGGAGLLSIGEPLVEFCQQGDDLIVGVGGDALNVAARAAAHGLRSRLVCVLSPDALGEWLAGGIRALGVELHARVGRGSTGLYGIRTAVGGERSFSYWRFETAAAELCSEDVKVMPEGFTILFVSGITQALSEEAELAIDAAVASASRSGMVVAYDPNYRAPLWAPRGGVEAARLAAERVLKQVDILLPSAEDCRLLWELPDPREASKRLGGETAHVVVKSGPDGAWLNIDGRGIRVPGHPASHLVDTTGAGDAFTGVYLAGLARGLKEKMAAVRAVEVASQTVTFPGALRDLTHAGDPGSTACPQDLSPDKPFSE